MAAQPSNSSVGGPPRELRKWTRLSHDGGAMHKKDVVPSNAARMAGLAATPDPFFAFGSSGISGALFTGLP